MGFVAAGAVSDLDYDLTGLDAGGKRIKGWPTELHDVKGTIPEPSQEQVRVMQVAVRKHLGLDETADADETAAEVEKAVDPLQARQDRDVELTKIYADACSQEPSTEQLLLLPNRYFAAFIGYISGEFFSPTAGTSATKLSLVPSKNAG